jgi:ATP-dependent Lon protease
MTRDSSNKLFKKEQVKRSSGKKAEYNLRKKKDSHSDSDNNNDSDSEIDEMDIHELRKYVQKIFPSKHMSKKIKAGENLKNFKCDRRDEEKSKPKKTPKKEVEESDDSEYEEEWEDEESDDDDWEDEESEEDEDEESDESEEEEEIIKTKSSSKKLSKNLSKGLSKKSKNIEEVVSLDSSDDDEPDSTDPINIIFTINSAGNIEDDLEDEDYESSDNATEDEDEEVSTDESSGDEEEQPFNSKKKSKECKECKECEETTITPKKKSKEVKEIGEVKQDKNEVLLRLKELLITNPKDKSIEKCIEIYKEDIKNENKKNSKKEKKQKDKNMRIFRKIISDKNTMNDFAFYEKLDIEKQKKLIKELREINKITRIEKPYRMTLLESNMPIQFKAAAIKKVNSLKYMEPGSGEFYKIKNWIDTFMRIPFTNNMELPISIEDGVEKCHDFMENAQKTLDEAVYGLNDAKMQIMQMLGQFLTNPKAIGTAIAIHGPPGTGKTSLVKEGISKILNRPFAFIALGGATDSSFLEGHGYTYEGSTWGKIVQILIDCKCMNPVIYFDELDKISDTPRGEEIVGILTHLTDTSQNSQFNDKYFAEINFDLSKCLFIFSYNDESKVNPILKDRMYRIKTKGYSGKEKNVIANNYLMPKIREQVRFLEGDITIQDDVLGYINDTHCHKEDGVRNMKRCLEIIHTKLNLYRLMKPGSNLFEGEMSLKVEFPFKITKDIVDKLIKKEQDNISALSSMYV